MPVKKKTRAELERYAARLEHALWDIHDREWPDLDYRKAARHAAEMWAISDRVLGDE